MNKKNGFTLVEVLVVVVIIGILLLIAVPAVSSYMKRGTTEYYTNLKETIILSGRDYFNDYRALLPKEIGNVTVIELNELVQNKYIKDVVDKNGNKCDVTKSKLTAKKVAKNQYEYYTCLICDDYNSGGDGENCSYNESENITAETKNYRVVVDNTTGYEIDASGTYIVSQGTNFNLPYGKVFHTKNGVESLINDKLVPSPKVIDTNKLGTVKVVYAYNGAKKEISVKVVDKVKPSKPLIVMKYDNKSGKTYKNEWTSRNIYQEFKSTDYTTDGIVGSGIDHYEISVDGRNYTRVTGNSNLTTITGEYNYYVRSVDKSGNISESSTYTVKVDNQVPDCTLEVKTGTAGSNGWYSTGVTVGFKNQNDHENDIYKVSGVVGNTIGNTTFTTNTTGSTVSATVTDRAGNVGTCSYVVKIDTQKPTIAAKASSNYITTSTGASTTGYFTVTKGISDATTTCKVGSTVVTNTNNLALGVNTVTCTVTSGAGLSSSASTVFRHQYTATAYCDGGRTLSNGNCTYYYTNNEAQCGCAAYKSCANAACGVSTYKSCATQACGVASYNSCSNAVCGYNSCATQACGVASYNSCADKACGVKTCTETKTAQCSQATTCEDLVRNGYSCKPGSGAIFNCTKKVTTNCGYKTCATAACGVSSYNTCENSACGNKTCQAAICGVSSYNSCRNSACGIESYKSCVTAACGCQTGGNCTKTENTYRKYQCTTTGNNGTTGTLSGTTCSF